MDANCDSHLCKSFGLSPGSPRCTLAFAAVLVCLAPAGAAPQRTLFLNRTPAQALSGATVYNALTQDIGRLVVPVFAGGRLAFQSHISPFSDEED